MFQYPRSCGLLFTNIFNLQLPLSSGILAPVVNGEKWPVIEGGADPVLWSGEKEVGGCSPGRLERYPEVAPGLVLETDPGLEMFQIPHPTDRVLTAVGDQADGADRCNHLLMLCCRRLEEEEEEEEEDLWIYKLFFGTNQSKNIWIKCDDDQVNPTPAHKVAAAQAYILFYQRKINH